MLNAQLRVIVVIQVKRQPIECGVVGKIKRTGLPINIFAVTFKRATTNFNRLTGGTNHSGSGAVALQCAIGDGKLCLGCISGICQINNIGYVRFESTAGNGNANIGNIIHRNDIVSLAVKFATCSTIGNSNVNGVFQHQQSKGA